MWDQLPELILTQIFNQLDCQDRVNVNQTCQTWKRILSSPILWRSITINIDKDLRNDKPLVRELIKKYIRYVKYLELAWSRPYHLPREFLLTTDINLNEGINFINLLKNSDVQLDKLILTDWYFLSNWNHRHRLFTALFQFLRSQKKLTYLSLLNTNLGMNDLLRLLCAATLTCGRSLKYLDIRGAFKNSHAPVNSTRYLHYFGRFHALTTFYLDYPALSDQILNILTNTVPKVLKNLHISIRDSDSRQHTILDSSWHNLVEACPQLAVSYTIINISHYDDVAYLLLPSVPLTQFYMYSGYVWDQSRSRQFRTTLKLLINYYTNTLVEVMLQFRNNKEALDDLLISLIKHCKRLKNLQYDGILRNLDTLKDIIQLQLNYKINFKKIHIKPRNVTLQNREILDEICYQYDHKMMDQGVDFCIDDLTSTRYFY